MSNEETVFKALNKIDVTKYVEKKQKLSYLSWANAWKELQKIYPETTYNILKFDGLPYVYDENTGYMVFTNMTIKGITHEMWLPVMDGANKAMKKESYAYTVKGWNGVAPTEKTVQPATMFDINKTIMRCLVKNIAMFGLGLYIYAGEDLPEIDAAPPIKDKPAVTPKAEPSKKTNYEEGKAAKPVDWDLMTGAQQMMFNKKNGTEFPEKK